VPQTNRATFLAIIPDTATAIQIHGGGGMRVRFDISEDQIPEALLLTLMRDKLLKVTVAVAEDMDGNRLIDGE
jgi:hypothetical protein